MRILLVLAVLAFGAGLAAQPEINIERNGSSIPSGGTVDLGTVDVLETTQVDFTIQNEGTTDLTLTGGVAVTDTDNCDTTVQQPGATTIPPGGSTTFQVHVKNNGRGDFSCDVTVPSNDADETTYAFMISGTAVADDRDDKDKDNCTTGAGGGGMMLVSGLAALGALAMRRRRRA